MSKRNITIFLHEHNVFAMDYKIYGCQIYKDYVWFLKNKMVIFIYYFNSSM